MKYYKDAAPLAHNLVLILQSVIQIELLSPWAASAQAPRKESIADGNKTFRIPLMRKSNEDGTIKESSIISMTCRRNRAIGLSERFFEIMIK